MKNLVIALAALLLISTASTSIKKFISVNNTIASNLCVIAAENGYGAAVNQAKLSGEKDIKAVTCNGKSIRDFSKRPQVEETISKDVLVIPADNSFESNLCAQAVKYDIKAVSSTTDVDVNQTICNGQQIHYFVKQYSNS
ncbi:MAG: hypothetical protein GY787_05495 [Alteromonadales bacterium]|nr:hypothetical protein [Alteromonadales bacterium]